MKTTTNNRKFLKLVFLAIGLCTFSGMKAQSASGWAQSGTTGQTVSTRSKDVIICESANSPTSTISMYGSSGDVKLYNNYGACELRTAATENIFLNTNFVGIGTTAPTNKLHVNGVVRASNAIIGDVISSAIFGNINALGIPATYDTNYSLMQGPGGSSFLNAKAGGSLYFRINNLDQATISDTKINFLNNVGIGLLPTQTPTHKLQVSGQVRANNAVIGSTSIANDDAFFGNFVALDNPGLSAKNYSLKQGPNGGTYVNASTGTTVNLRVNDVDQVVVADYVTTIKNSLIVEPSFLGGVNHFKGQTSFGTEKMAAAFNSQAATVSIDGRLIISDSDAAVKYFANADSENYKDYLLWVQEGIVATDFAITTLSQWPDYVFNKEYKLNSLNEVASFIKTNGHLPTMPSAKEIEKKGFTLSDMTQRTVKTVEELTLHAIEQQTLIDNQAQLIESLAKRLNALEAKQ